MNNQPNLEPNNFYHIYNRGINSCNLFEDENNYHYFLLLMENHLSPIADIYAWVLMPNHFHFLVKIKNLTGLSPNCQSNPSGLKKVKPPHQYFSNLFNAYTKAFNKYHHRHGALFDRPFKRKLIDSEDYLKQIVLYVHNNPIHHGFCMHPIEYAWSSYMTYTNDKPTLIQQEVLDWFGDQSNFEYCHKGASNDQEIEEYLNL